VGDLSDRQTDDDPPTATDAGGLAQQAYRTARKVVVAVLGVSLLLVGVAMIVLPGPAFLVIPMGLAVLSLEFAWARRWLRRARAYARRATASARLDREPRPRPPGRAASGVAS
jgi:tellurite resistance protein TerC